MTGEAEVRRLIREQLSTLLMRTVHKLAYSLPEAAHATGYSVGTLRQAIRAAQLLPS